MAAEIPVIPTDARLIYERPSDPRDVLIKEMEKRKIPISIGKTCPVKCTFCYEIDHGYRRTEEPGKTTQEDWNFILDYISKKPTRPGELWVWGGNEYMEWTDLFLHPKAMEWLEDFLKYTDKRLHMFTVGYVHVPKIHQLAAQYPNRIFFDLSVITLHKDYRKALMPHAPSVTHLMKVLDGPAVTSANFYSFDARTMSDDAKTISGINTNVLLWMGGLTALKGLEEKTAQVVHLPKAVVESPRGNDCDISGVTLEEFEAQARCKVRILHKVNTKLADTKLWQHGYLGQYIRDYLSNPVSREFEQIPIAA